MRFIANPHHIAEKNGPAKVTRIRFVQPKDVRISCWAATGFAGIVGCDEKLLHRVMSIIVAFVSGKEARVEILTKSFQ
jgi:hypothetical protein